MNLARMLVDAAAAWPARPAVALGSAVLMDFTAHADRVARLAAGMRAAFGLAEGDRVAIAMKNCPEFLDTLIAIWHAGLTAVPINAKLHPREFAYILENSGARVCVVTDDLEDGIMSVAPDVATLETVFRAGGDVWERLIAHAPMPVADVSNDDIAWLFYTSGTTGRPKGAMLSHRNLRAMTEAYFVDVDDISETDCIIHSAPKSHGSGLYMIPHLARGACQVVTASGGFDPDEVFDLLPHWPGATFFMAPTMVTRLINAPGLAAADMSNLKTIVYGGGPMYVEDCQKALERLGPKLVQIYGQGESPMTITALHRADHTDTTHPRYLDRLASVGRAQHGVEVRVTDDDDRDVATGEIGEILVRGDVVMRGYWQNADATAETLRGGWLHTGDLGALDQDGFLTLKDRSKDMIISGGSNIYPRGGRGSSVAPRTACSNARWSAARNHDWGEEVVAFIVARDGASPAEGELDALCQEHIARFKRPKAYRFIDALPKNNYGKVLKTALRELL